ncbi:methyltransferase domain-containing protein [Bartonella sp. LJL80]
MIKDDLETLYNLGLKLEKSGDFDGAEASYKKALTIDPEDHGGIRIRLASMGRGDVPRNAPRAYISTLFDQTAEMFDYILVDQLEYDVPLQLREALQAAAPDRLFIKMLDLGCGTGLSADALDDLAGEKTGVDLSENMIEIAYEKGDYTQLFVGDAVDFVSRAKETWDLIVATDVLPYMGEIETFFEHVSRCTEYGGLFCFSTESLSLESFNGLDYKVGAHQRFAHQERYIRHCLSANSFDIVAITDIVVRMEQGEPVTGQLFITRKAN